MTYRRSAEALHVEVEGRTVLLHATRWKYTDFDPIGAEIWRLLATPQTLQSLVETLRKQYRVDEETCRAGTEAVLRRLVGEGYLLASKEAVQEGPGDVIGSASSRGS
jgi:hypothetical protein